MRFKMNSVEPGAYFRNFRVLDELLSEWDKLKVRGKPTNPGPGQYLKHAHSHITWAVAAMDSRFALIALSFFKQIFVTLGTQLFGKVYRVRSPPVLTFAGALAPTIFFYNLFLTRIALFICHLIQGSWIERTLFLIKGACFSTVSLNNVLQALRGRR